MNDILKGAIVMIIAVGLVGFLFVEVKGNQLVKIGIIAIMLFVFPMAFPWPRWWFGGIVVLATCFCFLWGHFSCASMQPVFKSGPGGGIGVLFGLAWTFSFLAGAIVTISFRLLLYLRSRKYIQ